MTLDGLPVGTLRSNMADIKISADDWCRAFSHKMVLESLSGEYYCKVCYKTEKEINGETKETDEPGTGDC